MNRSRRTRAACEPGQGVNRWITDVLSEAVDPEFAEDEAERVRERLARAGLLIPTRCGGAELLGPQASIVFDYGDIGGLTHALRRVLEDGAAGAIARAAGARTA